MIKCDKCGQKYLPTTIHGDKCPRCVVKGEPGMMFNPQSIHDAAIAILQDGKAHMQRLYFREKLRAYVLKAAEDITIEIVDTDMPQSLFIPDLYEINEDNRTVALHEVEDESCLTMEKLCRICDLFWFLDDFDITLELYIYDRYGMSKRELNISAFSLVIGSKND